MRRSIVSMEEQLKTILRFGFVLKAEDNGFCIYVPGGSDEFYFHGKTILACIRKYNLQRKGRHP